MVRPRIGQQLAVHPPTQWHYFIIRLRTNGSNGINGGNENRVGVMVIRRHFVYRCRRGCRLRGLIPVVMWMMVTVGAVVMMATVVMMVRMRSGTGDVKVRRLGMVRRFAVANSCMGMREATPLKEKRRNQE